MNMKIVSGRDSIFINCKGIQAVFDQTLEVFTLDSLKKVSILTNDQGPFIDDMSLALFFEGQVIVVPSQHPSYESLFEQLAKVRTIDFGKVIEAATDTTENETVIYINPGIKCPE